MTIASCLSMIFPSNSRVRKGAHPERRASRLLSLARRAHAERSVYRGHGAATTWFVNPTMLGALAHPTDSC
jgi:hypothetical protein